MNPSTTEQQPVPTNRADRRAEQRGKRITDIKGVAPYLATNESHIRRLIASRSIPHLRVGRLIRFDLDAIDKWLAANARGGDAA